MNADGKQPAEDDIVSRMRIIRSQLPEDVQGVRGRVSELTSLRYYMRRYPLPLLGLATTAGFALVPSLKSPRSNRHDDRGQSTQEQVAQSSAKGSMIGGLLATAGSLLMRKLLTSAVDSAVVKFAGRGHQEQSDAGSHYSQLHAHPDDLVSHDRYTR